MLHFINKRFIYAIGLGVTIVSMTNELNKLGFLVPDKRSGNHIICFREYDKE